MKEKRNPQPIGRRGLTEGTKDALNMAQKCNGVNPEVSNPLDARVSFFDSVKAVRPSREITLREFLAEVQGGVYREKVEACRAVKDDETAYREMKKDTLPAVSLSGRLKNRAAGASKGLNHSGVVQIDLDDLEDPAGVKEQLRDDPHIVFAFYSVGGDVKAGIYIDGTQHDRAFRAAERYFLEKYGVRADGAVKSPFHLCFVSADADVHIREDATPFPIPDEPQAGRTRFDRDVPDLEGWDGDPEDLPAWLQEKIESIPSAEDRSRIEMSVIEDLIRFGLSNDQILDLYVILEDTLGVRWVERNSNSRWLGSQLKRARAHVAECAPGRPEDDFEELPDEPGDFWANLTPERTCCLHRGKTRPAPRPAITKGPGGLVRGIPAVIAGAGGASKTTLMVQLMASIASGRDYTGGIFELAAGDEAVFALLTEDDDHQVDTLFWNLQHEFGPLSDTERSRIHIINLSPEVYDFAMSSCKDQVLSHLPRYRQIRTLLQDIRPALTFLDPLANVFPTGNENDNRLMGQVVRLNSGLAQVSGGSSVISQHFNKSGVGMAGAAAAANNRTKALGHMEAALDVNSIRGGGALVAQSRWAMTLANVPAGVTAKLGHAAKDLVAHRVAKSNYSGTTSMKFAERTDSWLLRALKEENSMFDEDRIQDVVSAITDHPERLTRRKACRVISQALGMSRADVNRAVDAALDVGLLVIDAGVNASGVSTEYLKSGIGMDFLK